MMCRNCKAGAGAQLMAPLPSARVDSSRCVFKHCGVDFMEPLEVKQGCNFLRCYCCVFTCVASRSNHLEMAYDLTTGLFLMAMRRFQAVRDHGTRIIYLDNGRYFTRSSAQLKRDLKRLDDHNITNKLDSYGIEWEHNPLLLDIREESTKQSFVLFVRQWLPWLLIVTWEQLQTRAC